MDAQREDLPRISVETLQDWRRIKANFSSAVFEALDEQLAASRSSLANKEFVDRTFEISRPNIRVNGRNLDELNEDEEEIEPFDEGFDRHIWSLSDQSLKWDEDIAKKRRTIPLQVEELMQGLLEGYKELCNEESASLPDADDAEESGTGDNVTSEALTRIEQVSQQTYAISEELRQVINHIAPAVRIDTERASL
ncbi:hypothetical protein A0H81_04700 [Grifola frondosa]|uniref:Kinetochore protein mis14 n=1 Tax=Grifola frondosa TaxID=5627 RepID=A0A1C7MFU6_GRIFR|nr:hypothetical protein A0H81_04700 [Grifola frondosa]